MNIAYFIDVKNYDVINIFSTTNTDVKILLSNLGLDPIIPIYDNIKSAKNDILVNNNPHNKFIVKNTYNKYFIYTYEIDETIGWFSTTKNIRTHLTNLIGFTTLMGSITPPPINQNNISDLNKNKLKKNINFNKKPTKNRLVQVINRDRFLQELTEKINERKKKLCPDKSDINSENSFDTIGSDDDIFNF